MKLDTTDFQVETIQLAEDGSLPKLPDQSNVAYWIDGSDLVFMFVLTSTPENRALALSLANGSTAQTIWPNCATLTFTLSAPLPGQFEVAYLPDQTTAGIQIFILPDASGEGLVINGEEK